MDKHPFANIFLKIFHHMLPPIVSFSMKGIVKSLVPGISGLLLDPEIGIPNKDGKLDSYHVAINQAPIITKQAITFNVTLQSGPGNAFTPMVDQSKKSPFESYLEGYDDGNQGKFYRIQGLNVDNDFEDVLKSQHITISDGIPTEGKKSEKFQIVQEDESPRGRRTHSQENYKYF